MSTLGSTMTQPDSFALARSEPAPATIACAEPSASARPEALPRRPAVGFFQNVGVLTLASGFGAAAALVQGILVARWLKPELYGVASLVVGYPAVVYSFFAARSSDVSVKYIGTFHELGDQRRLLALCKWTYTIDLALAAVALLAVAATAPWAAARLARRPDVVVLMLVSAAGAIPRALTGTSYSLLAVLDRFSIIAWIEGGSAALRALLVLGLVLGGAGVAGVAWGNAVAMAATGLLYAAISRRSVQRAWNVSPWQGEYRDLGGYRREVFGFLAYNDLTSLVSLLPTQFDLLLLGYFRSPLEVGYYKLAKGIANAALYVIVPLQSATYPQLVRLLASGHRSGLSDTLRRLRLRVGEPLGLLLVVGVLLVPEVLRRIMGEAYVPAIAPTQIMLLGTGVWLSLFWVRPLFLALGAIAQWLKINSLVSVLSLAGCVLVIPRGGTVALSACFLAAAVLSHGMALVWLAHREDPLAELARR